MQHLKKGFVIILTLCLALGIFSGCSEEAQNAGSSPSPASSGNAEQELNAGKEKVKLSMILCGAGLEVPEGVDLNDNAWVNSLEEWANVDLTIDQPPYADYDQKLQLRISANDLLDIVHCIGTAFSSTAPQAARDGAFLPLGEYYENSRNVKNVITQDLMEWVKEPTTDTYYCIPMRYVGLPRGEWLIARWDLVSKYNNGEWPKTTPEWIALFEKIKEEMPDALVLSNCLRKNGYCLSYGGLVIYKLFGLPAWGGDLLWDYDNQRFESEFITPEHKAATNVMRDLYEKGVLDPEFATTEDWYDNKKTKNVVAEANEANQVLLTQTVYDDYPEGNDQIWRMADPLTEFPEVVRYPEVAYGSTPVSYAGHSMYIAASCKNPDRAFDVLEVMASEEFRDLCVWGLEGYSYTMEGEEKVPIPEVSRLDANDPDVFKWQRMFLTIWGYPSSRPYDEAVAKELDEEYAAAQIESTQTIDKIAAEIPISPIRIPGYVASDEVNRKFPESQIEMSTLVCNYIMGKMSEADYDQAIADWQEEYGFIADEKTEYINSFDKEEAKALGIALTLD